MVASRSLPRLDALLILSLGFVAEGELSARRGVCSTVSVPFFVPVLLLFLLLLFDGVSDNKISLSSGLRRWTKGMPS